VQVCAGNALCPYPTCSPPAGCTLPLRPSPPCASTAAASCPPPSPRTDQRRWGEEPLPLPVWAQTEAPLSPEYQGCTFVRPRLSELVPERCSLVLPPCSAPCGHVFLSPSREADGPHLKCSVYLVPLAVPCTLRPGSVGPTPGGPWRSSTAQGAARRAQGSPRPGLTGEKRSRCVSLLCPGAVLRTQRLHCDTPNVPEQWVYRTAVGVPGASKCAVPDEQGTSRGSQLCRPKTSQVYLGAAAASV